MFLIMSYNRYVISTIVYGIFAIFGIITFFVFIFQKRYFLVIISLLIVYVTMDNFFCGARANKVCKVKVKTHYTLPPFFLRKHK